MAKTDRSPSTAESQSKERRLHPRFRLAAAVEVTNKESGQSFAAQLTNLGLGGCQVAIRERLPLGTAVAVTITREGRPFHAEARTVYTEHGKAAGLLFTSVEPAHQSTLENWLIATQEARWLAAHRRRSQRVVMQVPVRVSGHNDLGSRFTEDTVTEIISANGALVLLANAVAKGQRLVLANSRTQAYLECTVVHFGEAASDSRRRVGLDFALQNTDFWQISFPATTSTSR